MAEQSQSCPWACNSGYSEYGSICHAHCPVQERLHAGTLSYPLFADKTDVPSPNLHVKSGETTCYVYLEPDSNYTGTALKVRYNNTLYRAIDPGNMPATAPAAAPAQALSMAPAAMNNDVNIEPNENIAQESQENTENNGNESTEI